MSAKGGKWTEVAAATLALSFQVSAFAYARHPCELDKAARTTCSATRPIRIELEKIYLGGLHLPLERNGAAVD